MTVGASANGKSPVLSFSLRSSTLFICLVEKQRRGVCSSAICRRNQGYLRGNIDQTGELGGSPHLIRDNGHRNIKQALNAVAMFVRPVYDTPLFLLMRRRFTT